MTISSLGSLDETRCREVGRVGDWSWNTRVLSYLGHYILITSQTWIKTSEVSGKDTNLPIYVQFCLLDLRIEMIGIRFPFWAGVRQEGKTVQRGDRAALAFGSMGLVGSMVTGSVLHHLQSWRLPPACDIWASSRDIGSPVRGEPEVLSSMSTSQHPRVSP